ncbi:MAG: site-specific integrase [Polyangiaceae bacterium]|nr:site-specific integrase [Polyangiaceae bacterium]
MGTRGNGIRREMRGDKPCLVIDFRYRGKDGRSRRYRRDATIQTMAGARHEASDLRLAAMRGTLEIEPRPVSTFGEFVAEQFVPVYMAARCRPATRERYETLFGQGILDAFGAKRLDEVDAMSLRAYAAKLTARRVQAWPHLSLVRSVLKAAVEFGHLAELPNLSALPKRGRKVPETPSTEEVQALLGGCHGWIRVAVALAAYAGMRSGEIRALEVRDVGLHGDRLLVRRALSGGEVLTPKSGHHRVVPIAPELRAVLVEASSGKLPAARIVTTATGATPPRQTVLSTLNREQARLGLPRRSFHSLRHYFCSTLIQRGAGVEAVRVLAGHSALAVTQRYVHATAADLTAAIRKLTGNQWETSPSPSPKPS